MENLFHRKRHTFKNRQFIVVSHKTGIAKPNCLSSKGLPKLSSFSASHRDNAETRIKFWALISEDLSLEITPYQNRVVMLH